jgi:hypothetical protein
VGRNLPGGLKNRVSPWPERRAIDDRQEKTKMMSRNLTRRVERLETRFTPTSDPLVLRMHVVSRER